MICLLIISIAIGIAILVQINRYSVPQDKAGTEPSVVGSYATCDPSASADGTYLVMESDGSYCIYKQLADKAIDEGSYRAGPDGKFIMESKLSDTYDVVAADGCIFLAGDGRTIMRFEKYDDVPSYINFNR